MKKILAFFGAFNPPTVAHIELAHFAKEQTGCDGVMFVPSKSAYIKGEQGKDYAYSDKERLGMLFSATSVRPWMLVTDIEICSESQPRTYTTLCKLREQGYAPKLLLGSDKLPELEKGWLHVKEIAEEFGIVCLSRSDDDCDRIIAEDAYLRTLSPYIEVLKTPDNMHMISSTAVRKLLKGGENPDKIKAMLPSEIYNIVVPENQKEEEK